MIDSRGRVLGVVTLKLAQAEGIGLAVPINYAYAEANAMVPAPAEGSDGRFGLIMISAETDDDAGARKLRETEFKPHLVNAARLGPTEVRIDVVQPAVDSDLGRDVEVSVLQAGSEVCRASGQIREWRAAPREALEKSVHERGLRWLDRHGIGFTVYMGDAVLNTRSCPSSISDGGFVEVELVGADEASARRPLM